MEGRTRTVLLFLAFVQAAMCNISPDPKTFFESVDGNLTKIVWAHAVNSRAELDKALAADDIMMLEADVSVEAKNGTDIPIMAHPPANQSDLSLEDFLQSVVKNGTKGIKLDFKSIHAFNISKPIIEKARQNLTFPVFLNADILPGPVNATETPVDAQMFLSGAKEVLPESTLSVGWTTRYGEKDNITEGRYTSEQVQKMLQTISENKVSQPVTYPVRAGLAANDIDAIKALMENSSAFNNATLTVWSSKGDRIDLGQLSKLIRDVGVDRVYVDLPADLKGKLDFSGASALGPTALISLGPLLLTLLLSRML